MTSWGVIFMPRDAAAGDFLGHPSGSSIPILNPLLLNCRLIHAPIVWSIHSV